MFQNRGMGHPSSCCVKPTEPGPPAFSGLGVLGMKESHCTVMVPTVARLVAAEELPRLTV